MRPSFDAALEDIERHDTSEFEELRPFAASVSSFAVNGVEGPSLAGGHQLWDFAAAWTPDADPPSPRPAPPPPPKSPRPSADAEVIAEELGLARLATAIEVAQARRRFMWDNHPDRRRDLDCELANRRVAVANMLLDRVLASLNRRRRGR